MYLAAPVLTQVQLGEKTGHSFLLHVKYRCAIAMGGNRETKGMFPMESKEDQRYILTGFCVLVTKMKETTSKRAWRDCYRVRLWKSFKG